MKWEEVTEIRQLSRTFLCPSLSEVYDLDWAPDSSHIVIGALEGKVILFCFYYLAMKWF